jgi:hypothetical protein
MKYIQPFDQPSNPSAPYVDLNEAMGVDGSIPPAKFFNDVQTEILNVIAAAGITPSDADLNQLLDAILSFIPTPTGAPSDASLVHFGIDEGVANAYVVTPSPGVAGVAQGLSIFFVPLSESTGASTLTVNPSVGAPILKSLVRDDLTAIGAGDVKAGRLHLAVFDGAKFRLAWSSRSIVVDGVTLEGAGTIVSPFKVRTVQSLAETGYIVHPNGMIEQWGRVSVPATQGPFDITFPIAFPVACYNVQATLENSSEHEIMDCWAQVVSKTQSGCRLYQQGAGAFGSVYATGCYWRALGK